MPVALVVKSRRVRRFSSCDFCFVVIWLLGQLAGYILASRISVPTFSHIRSPGFFGASFAISVCSKLAPFFVAYVALKRDAERLMLATLFANGLLLAFCVCCVGKVFGGAAWMIWHLCFFSNSLCMFLLLWCFFSLSIFPKAKQYMNVIACSAVGFIVTCVDYVFVSPFVVRLLE